MIVSESIACPVALFFDENAAGLLKCTILYSI